MDEDIKLIKLFTKWMNTDSHHACVNMYLNSSWNEVQRYTDEYNVRKSQNIVDVDTVIKFIRSVLNVSASTYKY
jgi:hypothetical protein